MQKMQRAANKHLVALSPNVDEGEGVKSHHINVMMPLFSFSLSSQVSVRAVKAASN